MPSIEGLFKFKGIIDNLGRLEGEAPSEPGVG